MEFGDNINEGEEIQYNEEPEEEEETEEMIAIRSITVEGYSESKAEEFHRKRNKPRVQREPPGYNAVQSNTTDSYSGSLTNHHQYEVKEKVHRDTEENMLAIRSITGEGFDPELTEQYIQETVIEQEVVELDQSIAGEDSSNLEQAVIAAADDLVTSDPDTESSPREGLGQTVAEHYNQKENIGTDLRKNSRIVYMRNFNNWTKSMLIDEFLSRCKASRSLCSPIKVLDMGSGKGGDMLKWLNGAVKHVVFADIASVSIEDCKNRYEDLKRKEDSKPYKRNVFSAEFIPADCSKIRLRSHYEDKALELDLVSCQFCIHYSFESVQQARCMLKNAAECLKPGGYFIGTVPDSNQIIARQRRHGSNSFGNDVYRIECLFDTSRACAVPLFGAKYHFNLEGVVNCPEFLVQFGVFERIAADFDLKLVLKENFKTFYERKIKEHSGMQLMRRMNAFETYPPSEGVDTVGQETDYCHAEAYLSEHPAHQKLGTLSKAEWEAITLYQVFAFEKVKSKPTSKRSVQDSPSSETSIKNAKTSQD